MLTYVVVGSGYRAEYFGRVARTWPELFRACYLCRSEEKAARMRASTGAKAVLLTGYAPEPGTVGFYYTDGAAEFAHAAPKIPRHCHGTGDLFAAVTVGGLMRGLSVPEAGKLAAEFVHRAIAKTGENSRFGVEFEGELGWLAETVLRAEG